LPYNCPKFADKLSCCLEAGVNLPYPLYSYQGALMAKFQHGPRTLSKTIGQITKPIFSKRGFADGAIISEWPTIAGSLLAAHSAPEKIDYPRNAKTGGTLRLRVESGSFALEVQHLEPQIIQRINTYFGYKAVGSIKTIQGPLPKQSDTSAPAPKTLNAKQESALIQELSDVDDDDIREALEKLGRSILSRSEPADTKK
jgi:hypothetical protein